MWVDNKSKLARFWNRAYIWSLLFLAARFYLFPSWPQNCYFYSQEVPVSEKLLRCSVHLLLHAVHLPLVPAVPPVIWSPPWRTVCCASPRPRLVSGWCVSQIPGVQEQNHMHCWHFARNLANNCRGALQNYSAVTFTFAHDCAKSSHYDRNPRNWEFHLRVKDFPTHIS